MPTLRRRSAGFFISLGAFGVPRGIVVTGRPQRPRPFPFGLRRLVSRGRDFGDTFAQAVIGQRRHPASMRVPWPRGHRRRGEVPADPLGRGGNEQRRMGEQCRGLDLAFDLLPSPEGHTGRVAPDPEDGRGRCGAQEGFVERGDDFRRTGHSVFSSSTISPTDDFASPKSMLVFAS